MIRNRYPSGKGWMPKDRTPKVVLAGADLRDVPLRRVNLSARSLAGADLRRADFREAELVGTVFSQADLRYADFREAFMGELGTPFKNVAPPLLAKFLETCVTHARFVGADLTGVAFSAFGWNVDFSRAELARADLSGGALSEVNFTNAHIDHTTKLPDSRNEKGDRAETLCERRVRRIP